MLAYAYKHTEEEDVITYDAKGKSVKEKVPRIPDEIQQKLRDKVIEEWPNKDVSLILIHCNVVVIGVHLLLL